MIDDKEFKELAKVHPRNRKPACIFNGEKAIVHSQWFVLELPKDEIQTTEEWPGKPLDFIRQWRYEQLAQGEQGEVAQAMRTSWPNDDEEDGEPHAVIQLMSENLQGYVMPEIFDFIKNQVERAEFRLFPGTRSDGGPANVGVFLKKEPVGVIAQITKREDAETNGWTTSL